MLTHDDNRPVVPFHGDHHPVEVYEGRESRNLLNVEGFTTGSEAPFYNIVESRGKIFTRGDDGSVVVTTQSTESPSGSIFIARNIILPAGTYTLTNKLADGSTAPIVVSLSYGNADDGWKNVETYTATGARSFTVNSDSIIRYAWYYVPAGRDINVAMYPMLEAGTVAHPYEPFGVYASPLYLPTESTASGIALEFEGTYNDAAEVSVAGRSEQAQYSGKNLANMANVARSTATSYEIDNGAIAVNAASGVNSNVYFLLGNTEDYAGKTYTFSCDFANEEQSNAIAVIVTSSVPNFTNFKSIASLGSNAPSKTFTVAPDADNPYIGMRFYEYGGGSGIRTCTFSNIQLELGSTATPYEPYVGGIPSPSPDYPQAIESVEAVTLESGGAQMLGYPNSPLNGSDNGNINLSRWDESEQAYSITPVNTRGSGVTGNVYYNPTAHYQLGANRHAGRRYTFSIEIKSPDSVTVYWYPSKGQHFTQRNATRGSGEWETYSFTYTATEDVVAGESQPASGLVGLIGLDGLKTGVTYYFRNAMLVEGEIPRPYEPYHAATLDIDLQGNQLRSLPDGTRDELVLTRSGKKWIDKVIGEIDVSDFTDMWNKSASFPGGYYRATQHFPNAARNPGIAGRCTHLKGAAYLKDYAVGTFFIDGSFNLRVGEDVASTVSEFAEWLRANKPHCLYPLATRERIDITDGEPLPTWYPYTRITAGGEDITAQVRVIDDGDPLTAQIIDLVAMQD